VQFQPKAVLVGSKTEISLIPHLGEVDQAALFLKTLDYEAPVFKWLMANVPIKYDLVLEIGANVGVYSVFFDRMASLPGSKLAKIIVFEPSPEAFRRLLENLRVNGTQRVHALQAAITPASGFQTFFEPKGHLTNGSFIREFAELFSDTITEREVVVIAAAELESFLSSARKALIKIDVEGFEPMLVASLQPLIQRYQPDLLIEVLEKTAEQLDQTPALGRYRKYLVTDERLEEAKHLFACAKYRDWLLLIEPAGLLVSAAPVAALTD
jgi:FkbM family methyltransferase